MTESGDNGAPKAERSAESARGGRRSPQPQGAGGRGQGMARRPLLRRIKRWIKGKR